MIGEANRRLERRQLSLLWAGPERAADIALAHGALFEKAWGEASIADFVADDNALSLVALIRDQAHERPRFGGFAIGRKAAGEAEILSIGVVRDHQRRGVACMMLDGLLRAAKCSSTEQVFLEVASDNMPAIGLYQRKGFQRVGQRARYYKNRDGADRDALVLALTL